MWWSSSSGEIELNITKKQAAACSHSGPCDDDVMALSKEPRIEKQIAKLDAGLVSNVLDGYGAWNEQELRSHAQNLQRLLWIACIDIDEEVFFK